MSIVEPGRQEVVYSQAENIGLPNWSFFKLMVSAKTDVPFDQYDAAYTRLSEIVDAYVMERAEQVAREIGVFYGGEGALQRHDEAAKAALVMTGFDVRYVEFTYSQTEIVGLPEKSSINILGSNKATAAPGQEWETLRYLSSGIARKLFEKRDAVKQNPRPWIHTQQAV